MKNQKGFSLVELLVVVIIIAIIAAIAIPNLLASRRTANEAAAAGNLRAFHSAQVTNFATSNTYATLVALGTANLIDRAWATGTVRNTYTYTEIAPSATFYCISANALPVASSQQKNYAVNMYGGIMYAAAGTAAACTAADGVITGATLGLGS